jgi:hypothetical protein
MEKTGILCVDMECTLQALKKKKVEKFVLLQEPNLLIFFIIYTKTQIGKNNVLNCSEGRNQLVKFSE